VENRVARLGADFVRPTGPHLQNAHGRPL